MICHLCGNALKGMADSRVVGARKLLACADLAACRMRQEDNERAARGLAPRRREHAPVMPITRRP